MSLAELFPTLRNLSRAEKLRVMQFLVQELRARHLLRFNPVVESFNDKPAVEVYQSFAY